jgi:molybdate transport system substrate-binding protein
LKSHLLFAAMLLSTLAVTGQAAERTLTVFGAASLTDVLEEVGKAFTAQTQKPVRFSFAASSALARQIESGAPADVFMSADQEWMDYLAARGLLRPDTRRDIVANTLVLVAPAASNVQLKIAPGFALAAALGERGRLATADPGSVPAGRYARAALTRLDVWRSIESRIIPAENVRTALNFVARGEAPLGIVYTTDARAESRVRIVDAFPASAHEPITYPAAATVSAVPEAEAFLAFLRSDMARGIFRRAGFRFPSATPGVAGVPTTPASPMLQGVPTSTAVAL